MKRSPSRRAVGQSLAIIAATLALVSGVTFAALQSQQDKLTGNTIETATADLLLSEDGNNFSAAQTGFDFNNLVPGGQPVPTTGYPFYLKNAGGTPLALKIALSSTPSNPDEVDLSKVTVILTTVGASGPQNFTLQSLIDAEATGGLAITSGNLNVGSAAEYKLQIAMDADAFTGNDASLGNIDFAFSGTAQTN